MKQFLIVFAFASMLSLCSFAQTASPTPAPSQGTITVPAQVAPPQWVVDALISAEKLPTIGPVLVKAFTYLGIIATILTSLVAFVLASTKALSGIANLAGLTSVMSAVQNFQNGKIMYWLKYCSNFNAVPTPPAPQVAVQDSANVKAAA